jgi:hypothetical protein
MEVSDSIYEKLAQELRAVDNEYRYFSGYIVVDDFMLAIWAVLYPDDIVPVWWEVALNVDFEFDKLRTKYKELCKK